MNRHGRQCSRRVITKQTDYCCFHEEPETSTINDDNEYTKMHPMYSYPPVCTKQITHEKSNQCCSYVLLSMMFSCSILLLKIL
jgi:hypothetical protein